MDLNTANRLCEYRKNKGLSQEELANMLNVSRQAVSNWERGETSPEVDTLIELSKIYEVTLDELVFGKKEEKIEIKDEVVEEKKNDELEGATLIYQLIDESINKDPEQLKNNRKAYIKNDIIYLEKNNNIYKMNKDIFIKKTKIKNTLFVIYIAIGVLTYFIFEVWQKNLNFVIEDKATLAITIIFGCLSAYLITRNILQKRKFGLSSLPIFIFIILLLSYIPIDLEPWGILIGFVGALLLNIPNYFMKDEGYIFSDFIVCSEIEKYFEKQEKIKKNGE